MPIRKKFSSLNDLVRYFTVFAATTATAVGVGMGMGADLPAAMSASSGLDGPHAAPHDHAHDDFGHAVEGREVVIDVAAGARGTDACSGDVAVDQRAIHLHAVQSEDGSWTVEDDDYRVTRKVTRDDARSPGVWERTELRGELPHGDDHDHGDHDHDHEGEAGRGQLEEPAQQQTPSCGITDHLGHEMGEGERQVDTAFEVRVSSAAGKSLVPRGGSHLHFRPDALGTGRRLAEDERDTYFEGPTVEPAPGIEAAPAASSLIPGPAN